MTDFDVTPWDVPLPPIHAAAETGDVVEATRLLDADPDLVHSRLPEGDQPLHLACWQKHAAMVRLLIERGADEHARGDSGLTPLHYAVYEGDEQSTQIVRILLETGADVNAKDNQLEQNALGFAVREQHEGLDDTIALMRDHGAIADLEVAMLEEDFTRAEQILDSDPGMSIARIRAIRECANLYWIATSEAGDRSRFVELIDRWLNSKEA